MRRTIQAGLLVSLVFLCTEPGAHAQRRHVPDHVLLARICVSEAGWQCWDSGDGLAIYEVLSTGAARYGVPFATYARRYAPRATGVRPSEGRTSWVAQLQASGVRPVAWPSTSPWHLYRPQWFDVLETAEDVLSLDGSRAREWSPCASEVHDWASSSEPSRQRASRLGLIPVNCGTTLNRFYARPSVIRTTRGEE